MRPPTATVQDASIFITFLQQKLPGFRDGKYQLTLQQHLEDAKGNELQKGPTTQSYTFSVVGDRFRLTEPVSSIYATFPENAAAGNYATVLPHVVLTVPTLPWARSPTPAHSLPPVGSDASGDEPTWLAILLLDAGDVAAHPGLVLEPAEAVIGDLLPTTVWVDSRLGPRLSYFRGATGMEVLDPGEAVDTPIRVLDLPLPLFREIAPTLADLALLAHVRSVSLVNKPTVPGVSDQGVAVGDFAVVVGNRLPATDTTSYAYLVSLEGLSDLLPSDPPAVAALGDAAAVVRLAVLQSWRFTSTGSTATFTDTLLALNGRDPKGTDDAPFTALGLPWHTGDVATTTALGLGYVPLDHNLRDGGTTVSWYRGPFAPVAVPDGRIMPPLASADQAMMFDPTTGLIDASYAAAWTLGRLVAVQDKAFSAGLYHWKRGLRRLVIDSVEEAVLAARFTMTAPPPVAANALFVIPERTPPLTPAQSAPLAGGLHRSVLLALGGDGEAE